ncbi:MAG: alcohol dehydrogenase catalytic domain-containing protein [Pseudomonadota bacterium]
MKALVYTGTEEVEIREADLPVAEPGQAVVDVAVCGICGSDMHAYHGHDPRRRPPLVLGHEAAGTVREGSLAGRRVAINPLMTCGKCPACLGGREHLCPYRELIGMRVPGAFAERVAINASNLTVLDDGLSFEAAALAEPLACAVHTVRLGLEREGQGAGALSTIVLGGGAIGLLCALVLRAGGADRVAVAEANPLRRDSLAALDGLAPYEPIAGEPDAASADCVIDAVGSGRTRAAAARLVRPGGTIVHIGLQDEAPGLDTRRITLQEIAFIGSYCYTRADFAEALRLLGDGLVEGTGWTEERGLDDGAAAFRSIHDGTAPPKILLTL